MKPSANEPAASGLAPATDTSLAGERRGKQANSALRFVGGLASAQLRYRKRVPFGVPLGLVGFIDRKRGRVATGRSELRLPDGTIGAEAEATLVDYSDTPEDAKRLAQLGWAG